MNVHQAAACQREAATRKSMESDEMAQARAWAETVDLTREDPDAQPGGGGEADTPITGLLKTKVENELQLLGEKAKELKAWIIAETTAIITRMLTAWGVESSATTPCTIVLEGSSLQARQDIEQHRDASVMVLAAWEDTVVKPLVERLQLNG